MQNIFAPQRRREFTGRLDEVANVFSDIMSSVGIKHGHKWSFGGGFARDLYLGLPYNDFDVIVEGFSGYLYSSELQKMKVLAPPSEEEVEEQRIIQDELRLYPNPHNYFVNPYDFKESHYPVHIIESNNSSVYGPEHFDFSLNHLTLHTDGYFYAPNHVWRDLDNKQIRLVGPALTINTVMRLVRFRAKTGFSVHPNTEKKIKKYLKGIEHFHANVVLLNMFKMREDNLEEESFEIMKEMDLPRVAKATDFESHLQNEKEFLQSPDGHYGDLGNTSY